MHRKLKTLEMIGGKCVKCGYNKNISALHFHHKDSTEKAFMLGLRILSNHKWEAILEEAKKCEVLCANCHADEHNPELTFAKVKKITNGAAGEKPPDVKGVNSGKP